jgi:hypothetical protein
MNTTQEPDAGIELDPFSEQNADLVLSWRNSDIVRANSLDNEVVSRRSHQEFLKLQEERPNVFYWVVRIDGNPQAVLNLDARNQNAYWGCHLRPDGTVRPGLFPQVILVAVHLAFERCESESLDSDVLAHNLPPQTMNAYLGMPVIERRTVVRPSGDQVEALRYSIVRGYVPTFRAKALTLLTQRQMAQLAAFARGSSSIAAAVAPVSPRPRVKPSLPNLT